MVRKHHKNIFDSWGQQWNAMFANGVLTCDWQEETDEMLLMDLISFLFTVAKARRAAQKAAWAGKSKTLLDHLQLGVLRLLEEVLIADAVDYMSSGVANVYDLPIPARVLPGRTMAFVGLLYLF